MKYHIKDPKLANKGKLRIEWAGEHMPVLKLIGKRFKKEKPLKGLTIGACLHITAETANLLLVLKDGGAEVFCCASNPLSTQDDVAASLVKDSDIATFAIKGEDTRTYYKHLEAVLLARPQITMDDGADLVTALHKKLESSPSAGGWSLEKLEFIGSSEETTTGVIRLKAMERDSALKIPVMAVNDSDTKHLFDNRYGTGQSTIDGIMRATNILLAGKIFVVVGYGWCGRGAGSRARGMGAQVVVTEVDPIRALEAVMDGFMVMSIREAAKIGDIFLTATGDKHVIDLDRLETMKDGAIVANTGHFNVEFDYLGLVKKAKRKRQIRDFVEEFTMSSGKRLYILGEGRLINLVAAEGHPPDVMDMSFANQALAAEWLVQNKGQLEPKVYRIPRELDAKIAQLKLESMGLTIDQLTAAQKNYLESWKEGT